MCVQHQLPTCFYVALNMCQLCCSVGTILYELQRLTTKRLLFRGFIALVYSGWSETSDSALKRTRGPYFKGYTITEQTGSYKVGILTSLLFTVSAVKNTHSIYSNILLGFISCTKIERTETTSYVYSLLGLCNFDLNNLNSQAINKL